MRSVIGRVRKSNQDAGYLHHSVALLADGVGGGPSGDLASASVITSMAHHLEAGARDERSIRGAVALANAQLDALMVADPVNEGMATTLTGVVPFGSHLAVINIGDSRVYRCHHGVLEQVSRDDSLIQNMIDDGLLTPEEASTYPLRNLLTHSLAGSMSDAEFVSVRAYPATPGDRWVVVTDGVTDYCNPAMFASIIQTTTDPRQAADALIEVSWPVSRDNMSVIVADVVSGAGEDAIPQFSGSAAQLPLSELWVS